MTSLFEELIPECYLKSDIGSTEFMHLIDRASEYGSMENIVRSSGSCLKGKMETINTGNQLYSKECARMMSILNQELVMVGMQPIPLLGSGTTDLSAVINVTLSLIDRLKKSVKTRENLEDRNHRASSDLEYHQQERERLKQTMEELEREIVQCRQTIRQLERQNEESLSKLKSEREESKRRLATVQSRDAQFRHTLKKKEMEVMKLKEHLHCVMNERSERKTGIHMSEILSRRDGRRGKWSTIVSGEEEMYSCMISKHKDLEKALVSENHELRRALGILQRQLLSICNDITSNNTMMETAEDLNSNCNNNAISSSSEEDITASVSDEQFELPYSVTGDQILANLSNQIHRISTRFQNLSHSDEDGVWQERESRYKREIDLLESKLERYRAALEHLAAQPIEKTRIDRVQRSQSYSISDDMSGGHVVISARSGNLSPSVQRGSVASSLSSQSRTHTSNLSPAGNRSVNRSNSVSSVSRTSTPVKAVANGIQSGSVSSFMTSPTRISTNVSSQSRSVSSCSTLSTPVSVQSKAGFSSSIESRTVAGSNFTHGAGARLERNNSIKIIRRLPSTPVVAWTHNNADVTHRGAALYREFSCDEQVMCASAVSYLNKSSLSAPDKSSSSALEKLSSSASDKPSSAQDELVICAGAATYHTKSSSSAQPGAALTAVKGEYPQIAIEMIANGQCPAETITATSVAKGKMAAAAREDSAPVAIETIDMGHSAAVTLTTAVKGDCIAGTMVTASNGEIAAVAKGNCSPETLVTAFVGYSTAVTETAAAVARENTALVTIAAVSERYCSMDPISTSTVSKGRFADKTLVVVNGHSAMINLETGAVTNRNCSVENIVATSNGDSAAQTTAAALALFKGKMTAFANGDTTAVTMATVSVAAEVAPAVAPVAHTATRRNDATVAVPTRVLVPTARPRVATRMGTKKVTLTKSVGGVQSTTNVIAAINVSTTAVARGSAAIAAEVAVSRSAKAVRSAGPTSAAMESVASITKVCIATNAKLPSVSQARMGDGDNNRVGV